MGLVLVLKKKAAPSYPHHENPVNKVCGPSLIIPLFTKDSCEVSIVVVNKLK